MKRDRRINKNSPGEFRTKLFFEDISIPVYVGAEDEKREGEYISFPVGEGKENIESAYIFTQKPIKVPFMQHIFRNKITTTGEVLYKIVRDLMYFNPKIDTLGVKKMTEFILGNCVKQVESDKFEFHKKEPVLSFEEIHPVVKNYATAAELDECNLVMDIVVVYSKNSNLTRGGKISFTRSIREGIISSKLGEVIHNAVVMLIETESSLLKITNPRILKAINNSKVTTPKTIVKHIKEPTKITKDAHNSGAPFRTEKSLNKYEEYKGLKDSSNSKVSRSLGVSLSTVQQFKKLKDNEINCD